MGGMKTDAIEAVFERYCAGFPREDMVVLKIEHTRRVAANARQIMEGEGFPERLRGPGMAAAWWHDVGRFPQFTKYHTFSDRVSVNHALMSCAEVLRLGWLDGCEPWERNAVLRAIECHNLRDLPSGLSADELPLAQVVRDADKLDILTVLDRAIATDYLPSHPEVYWGLPFRAPPSAKVVAAIERGESVDYADITSFADFVFIQLAWCNGGFAFGESRRLALARGEVRIRREYLKTLVVGEEAVIDRCCDIAETALREGGRHGA